MPCGAPRERCYLAMALSRHTGPRPHPVPPQPFPEPLYSVPLLLPRLFGLENSWKYSSQTTLLLAQTTQLSPVLTHLVNVISSLPSCGRNRLLFPVLCGQYAYQTCPLNLERLRVMNTSARSLLPSNHKKSHRRVRLLLSVCYHPLMPVTLHPSR